MRNLTLLTDLYEYSMANGFQSELPPTRATFDVFFRQVPDHGSFVVAAGLQQVVQALDNFHFGQEDLDYLRGLHLYSEAFLQSLSTIKLDCTVQAVPEGMPVFPREPLLTITGPIDQVQMLETLVLNILNHQSLIATKSRRINFAAGGRPVMEFGARRAQGPDSAVYGTRAAVIGGCGSTSNVLAAQEFGIPVAGTMAHSWVESFASELDAFRAWARVYPDNSALLVDTYDVLGSGVPNAITVFRELAAAGHQPVGIRIDSGDITALAKAARAMLDDAGFPDAKITASNALNEQIITALLQEGAPLDNFGVGEELITSSSSPVLSGVYKLAVIEQNGHVTPKIKLSASKAKVTLPGRKQVYRLYRPDTGAAFADVIALADETVDGHPLTVVNSDPLSTHKQVTLTDYVARPLLRPVTSNDGHVNVFDVQRRSRRWLGELPQPVLRLVNPDTYHVYLAPQLAALQTSMLQELRG